MPAAGKRRARIADAELVSFAGEQTLGSLTEADPVVRSGTRERPGRRCRFHAVGALGDSVAA